MTDELTQEQKKRAIAALMHVVHTIWGAKKNTDVLSCVDIGNLITAEDAIFTAVNTIASKATRSET